MADTTLPGLLSTGIHASRPAAGDVGSGALYSCTTHSLVYQSDGSSWSTWATLGSTGSVATDAIWDAAGDLAVGSGANTAAKLSIGSEGDVLTVSGGAVAWDAPAGGGGGWGMSSSKYNPDHETPATTPDEQNEFNSGTIGSGWAWGTTPTVDYTSYPGFARVEHTTGNHWLSKAWTPGATDVTVAAKLLIARPISNSTDNPTIFVGFADATGTDPTNAVLAAIFPKNVGAGSTFNIYNKGGGYSAVGSDLSFGAAGLGMFSPVWVRLTRVNSGPTWSAYFSLDGMTWMRHASQSTKSMTIGAITLRFSDQANVVFIDWIRAWDSVVEKVGA